MSSGATRPKKSCKKDFQGNKTKKEENKNDNDDDIYNYLGDFVRNRMLLLVYDTDKKRLR